MVDSAPVSDTLEFREAILRDTDPRRIGLVFEDGLGYLHFPAPPPTNRWRMPITALRGIVESTGDGGGGGLLILDTQRIPLTEATVDHLQRLYRYLYPLIISQHHKGRIEEKALMHFLNMWKYCAENEDELIVDLLGLDPEDLDQLRSG